MCVRKVKDTVKDSMFSELKKRIKEWKLDDHFHITQSPLGITNKITGCQFIFRWIDDPEKVKSVEWVARIRVEEATELEKIDLDQLDLRLRGKENMQITCTFNPTDAEHFLNTDFRVKGNTEEQVCVHTTYKDNRFVGVEYEKVMDRLKETNINYYNIYALGQRWVLDWLIFDNRNVIKDVPAEAELLWYGLDFWYTNDPTALVALYKRNNSLLLDEIIYKTWLTNTYRRVKNEDWVSVPISIEEKENSIVWLLEMNGISRDYEIRADSSEPKSIEEIFREDWNVKPVSKWQDSIRAGIDIMKQYPILVTARSGNIQKEFKKYVWATDKSWKPTNKPIDAMNHAIDASRYWAMSMLNKNNDLELVIW